MTTTDPSGTPSGVLSHWVRSTPEEGIQCFFNREEVYTTGVQLHTEVSREDSSCQWVISLRPLRPCSPSQSADSPSTNDPSISRIDSNPALLLLTLGRAIKRDGTGLMRIEDDPSAGYQRSDHYRTMYVYSPKTRRDVCMKQMQKGHWPQTVVLSEWDITESKNHDYNFQIWLSGSCARNIDIRCQQRLDQCQQLLSLLRQDRATANVKIRIKNTIAEDKASSNCDQNRINSERARGSKRQTTGNERLQEVDSRPRKLGYDQAAVTATFGGSVNGEDVRDGDSEGLLGLRLRRHYLAHKCILETNPFFHRMLNTGFHEGQADASGMYNIELSSDLFDAGIMDLLLDYLYTRGPRHETLSEAHHKNHGRDATLLPEPEPISEPSEQDQTPHHHHVVSANVQLNLQSATSKQDIGNTRHFLDSSDPSTATSSTFNRYSEPVLDYFSNLSLADWCSFYRASIPLEDKYLQSMSLKKIQDLLDDDTTLEQVLHWGHQHEEVKAIMVDYLVKKRKDVFGDEERNSLRPYLWADDDYKVDTLIHITSRIARQ